MHVAHGGNCCCIYTPTTNSSYWCSTCYAECIKVVGREETLRRMQKAWIYLKKRIRKPLSKVVLSAPFSHRITMGLSTSDASQYFETKSLLYESSWQANCMPIIAAANGGVEELTVSLYSLNHSGSDTSKAMIHQFWRAIESCAGTLVKLRLQLSFRHDPDLKKSAVDALAHRFPRLEVLALEHKLYGLTSRSLNTILSSPTCRLTTVDNCQSSVIDCMIVDLLPNSMPTLKQICTPMATSYIAGPPTVWTGGPLPLVLLMSKAPNLQHICFNHSQTYLTEQEFRAFLLELDRVIVAAHSDMKIIIVNYSYGRPNLKFLSLLLEHDPPAVVRWRLLWSQRSTVLNMDYERYDGICIYLSVIGRVGYCAVSNDFSSYPKPLPPYHRSM